MTNLNKGQYKDLLLESLDLASRLEELTYGAHSLARYRDRARPTVAKLWQRHWRRVTDYNRLFSESRYVPAWYIAERERKNAARN